MKDKCIKGGNTMAKTKKKQTESQIPSQKKEASVWMKLWQARYIYLLLLPMIVWLFVFHYLPTSGIILAFKKYRIGSLWSGEWIGLDISEDCLLHHRQLNQSR